MSEILVLGGGLNGLSVALLLARDGHEVTVLERDNASPPAAPEAAWEHWERRGVNQFRMLHVMLPRWRAEMERELPDVLSELESWGGLRFNLVARQPVERTGGWRAGDEQFETVTGRRPVLEAALAAVANRTPGIQVRRGVAVTGLVTTHDTGAGAGVPCVGGALVAGGDTVRADLVADTCGRRSPLPAWLDAVGAAAPIDQREDSGFVYYGRHFRSDDGALPEARTSLLTAHESLSILTLPADNGTWGVGFITSARDRPLRALRDEQTWDRLLSHYPESAHWRGDAPLAPGVAVMAGIEDRHRSLVVDGRPVVTGIVAVGDSWACTNPSLGRGASIGLLHACLLRDLLRDIETADAEKFACRFHESTCNEIEPLYRMTLDFDRHRLAEIEADIQGAQYEPDDPAWAITKAMSSGATADSDVLRAFVSIAALLATPQEVLSAPGLFERVVATGAAAPRYPGAGPDRGQILRIIEP